MPQNSFRNIGLRRDRNFSDLENKQTGLTNLLNNFPSGNDTYIADDLNEAIKTIRSYPVLKSDINKLAGITFKNTYFDSTQGSSVTAPAQPLVTVKNQFDRVKLEVGEISYFGGDVNGIKAKFYNSSQINEPAQGTPQSSTLFSGSPVIEKNFWLDGSFIFENKFNSALDNQQGGVQWDGYLVPESNGDLDMNIKTTCNFLLELDGIVISHLRNKAHSVIVMYENVGTTEMKLFNPEDLKYIAQGCLLKFSSFSAVITGIYIDTTGDVFVYLSSVPPIPANTYTATVYTRYWSDANGTAYTALEDDTSYPSFEDADVREPGTTNYIIKVRKKNIEEFDPLSFVASIWLPTGHNAGTKSIVFTMSMLLGTTINNNYYNFLNTLPSSDPADFPDFKKFFDNRLLQDGGQIGTDSINQSILTNKSINAVEYTPPDYNTILNKQQPSVNVSSIANTNFVTEDPLDPLLYAEVGNIFYNSDNSLARVLKVINSVGLVFDKEILPSDTVLPLDLINHRGLVKVYGSGIWSATGVTITVNSVEDIIPGMMFIHANGKTEITKILSSTSFEVAQAVTTYADFSYVYYDAGILNYTTYNVVTVIDTSTFVLDTVYGIQAGYYIKSIGKPGTEHLQEIASVDENTNTITTVSSTTGDILAGDKLIAERANVNTAPPFEATLTGLTTNNSNIKLSNPNGIVRAKDIEVQNYLNATTEFDASQDNNYYTLIDITINNETEQTSTPFKILASTFDFPDPNP